jgi:uncharacterized protein (TIGR03435 family)
MRYAAIALLLLVGQPAAPKPSFEVVSVKRNLSGQSGGGGGFRTGGRFQITNVWVELLIRLAYRQGATLFPSQIVGGPEWMRSDGYDIAATVGGDLAGKTPVELLPVQPMLLQSLLEDRFKLKVHRETRELQRYALVLARKDKVLGPQLRPSRIDCSVDFTKCSLNVQTGAFTSGSTPIAALANYLASTVVQTVVVDRTGLEGRYEITLEWTPDRAPLPPTGDAPPAAASDKPSIFAALQEQLGLKLEPERGPVDVVVIDHVERPTEN